MNDGEKGRERERRKEREKQQTTLRAKRLRPRDDGKREEVSLSHLSTRPNPPPQPPSITSPSRQKSNGSLLLLLPRQRSQCTWALALPSHAKMPVTTSDSIVPTQPWSGGRSGGGHNSCAVCAQGQLHHTSVVSVFLLKTVKPGGREGPV